MDYTRPAGSEVIAAGDVVLPGGGQVVAVGDSVRDLGPCDCCGGIICVEGSTDLKLLCSWPLSVYFTFAGIPDAGDRPNCRSGINGTWTIPRDPNYALIPDPNYQNYLPGPPPTDANGNSVTLGFVAFCSGGLVYVQISGNVTGGDGTPCNHHDNIFNYVGPMTGCGPWVIPKNPLSLNTGYPDTVTVYPTP